MLNTLQQKRRGIEHRTAVDSAGGTSQVLEGGLPFAELQRVGGSFLPREEAQKEEGLPIGGSEALVNQQNLVAGVRFELTTFGL